MSGVDQDLVRLFWERAGERIGEATDLWLRVEDGDAEGAAGLRRLLHTMKGEAHMLGLSDLGGLLQAMEDVVDLGVGAIPQGAGDVVLASLDMVSMMAASEPGARFDTNALLEQLRALAARGESEKPAAERRAAHAADPAPQAAPVTDESAEAFEPTHEAPTLDPFKLQSLVHETRRLHREHALLQPNLREVRRMLRALLAEIDPRLPAEVLAERIVKTLGYGAEIERKMADLGAQWSTREFALGLALEQLDERVREAAMVSVGALRAQMHRAGRAAARALGKKVEIAVTGDAHVDAAVERMLGPVLLHLVRNAVDHGIEMPDKRKRAGKNETGHITVLIRQTDANVVVVVQDDGGGVDLERLRARFGDADSEELLQRIFEHGVSTRTEVTEISGRGVGLDVVARDVSALGGTVRVQTSSGAGTRFELVLPTTLRADVVVPIEVRGARMAIAARAVAGVERITEPVVGHDGVRLRRGTAGSADLVPIYDAGGLLGTAREPAAGDVAVIIQHRAGLYALRVDRYDNPRALAFTRMDEIAVESPMMRGVAPLPDGGVCILLDADAVYASLSDQQGGARGARTERKRAVAHVLVVEDAPVARELLLGILRSFGLRVSDAADGRQGLSKARSERPDLVLTDIEMPFLGGLEMVAEMRKDPALRDLPVIVLSTRIEPEVQRRAQALGVRAFLAKQRFVEAELRQVIDACLTG